MPWPATVLHGVGVPLPVRFPSRPPHLVRTYQRQPLAAAMAQAATRCRGLTAAAKRRAEVPAGRASRGGGARLEARNSPAHSCRPTARQCLACPSARRAGAPNAVGRAPALRRRRHPSRTSTQTWASPRRGVTWLLTLVYGTRALARALQLLQTAAACQPCPHCHCKPLAMRWLPTATLCPLAAQRGPTAGLEVVHRGPAPRLCRSRLDPAAWAPAWQPRPCLCRSHRTRGPHDHHRPGRRATPHLPVPDAALGRQTSGKRHLQLLQPTVH